MKMKYSDIVDIVRTDPSKDIPNIGNEFFIKAMASVPESLRALAIEIWKPTPFMLDVYVELKEEEMMSWLRIHLGKESSPIHGVFGLWKRSQVTIMGHSWIGFQTEEQMISFCNQFIDLKV